MSDADSPRESSLRDRALGTERAALGLGVLIGSGMGVTAVDTLAPSLLPPICVTPLLIVPVYYMAVSLGVWAGAGPLVTVAAALPLFVRYPSLLGSPMPAILYVWIPLLFAYGFGTGLRYLSSSGATRRNLLAVGFFLFVFGVAMWGITWVLNLGSSPAPGPPNIAFTSSYDPETRTLSIRHTGGDRIEDGRVVVLVNGSRQGVHLVANRTNTTGVWFDATGPAAASGPLTPGDSVKVRDVAGNASVRVVYSDGTERPCRRSWSGTATLWIWERDDR